MRLILCLVVIFVSTGCATVINGTTQTVYFPTSTGEQVKAVLQKEKGKYGENVDSRTVISYDETFVTLPTSLVLKRSGTYYMKVIDRCAEVSSQKIESTGSWALAGNILLGGLIGIVVDFISGGAFAYDDIVMVQVQPLAVCRKEE